MARSLRSAGLACAALAVLAAATPVPEPAAPPRPPVDAPNHGTAETPIDAREINQSTAAAKNLPLWAMRAYPAPRPAAPVDAPRPVAGPNYPAHVTDAARPPKPRRRVPPSCSRDGAHCIAPLTYDRDVCRTLRGTAREAGIDPHFFARLIWQESLFDPYAISPAGALGIAQFIPSTAKLRGLDDPFNPAAALQASARYLADLIEKFGNPGMAAIAYNGGEGRAASFAAREGGLPGETRHYVRVITSLPAEAWRDTPPESFDLSLDPSQPFEPACRAMAAGRAPGSKDRPRQWALIYSAHPDHRIASTRAEAMRRNYPSFFADAEIALRKGRLPGRTQPYFLATLPYADESAARRQCNRLRVAGGGCMVLQR